METTGQWKPLKNRWKVDENQLKTQLSNNDFHFGPVKIQPFGSCSVGNRLRRTRQMRWWMRLFDFFGPKRNWVELVMPEEHILSITWNHETTILLLHQSYLEWNRSSDLDLRIFFSFSEEKFSLGWAALNSNFHSVFKKNEPITGLKRTLSISPHQATKRWSIHRLSWRVLLKRLPKIKIIVRKLCLWLFGISEIYSWGLSVLKSENQSVGLTMWISELRSVIFCVQEVRMWFTHMRH